MPHPQPHKLPSDPSQLRQRREEAYSGRGNFMPVQSSVGSRCRRPVTFRPRRGTSGPISFTCNTYAFLASKDLFQASSIDHSPGRLDEREPIQDVGTSSTVGQANDTATEDAVVSTILHPNDRSGSFQLYLPVRSGDAVGHRSCTGSREGRILCWSSESDGVHIRELDADLAGRIDLLAGAAVYDLSLGSSFG
jgi:hypothetical protein